MRTGKRKVRVSPLVTINRTNENVGTIDDSPGKQNGEENGEVGTEKEKEKSKEKEEEKDAKRQKALEARSSAIQVKQKQLAHSIDRSRAVVERSGGEEDFRYVLF